MARDRQHDVRSEAVDVERPVDRRHEPVAVGLLLAHGLVEGQQDLARRQPLHRGGADRVARERGELRRLDALAGDVADHEPPRVGALLEDVEEVADDLVAAGGGQVASGHLHARDAWEIRRQQARLQRAREGARAGALEVGALACRALVLQGDVQRDLAGRGGRERLEHVHVLVRPVARPRVHDAERSEHLAGRRDAAGSRPTRRRPGSRSSGCRACADPAPRRRRSACRPCPRRTGRTTPRRSGCA